MKIQSSLIRVLGIMHALSVHILSIKSYLNHHSGGGKAPGRLNKKCLFELSMFPWLLMALIRVLTMGKKL